MKNSEREAYAKRVVHYYENCVARNLKKVIEHFEKEGKRPQNITAIVKRYLINGTVEYRKSTGRPSSVSSAKCSSSSPNRSILGFVQTGI
jgi:hypothetical protein